jgi:hypothetical protein
MPGRMDCTVNTRAQIFHYGYRKHSTIKEHHFFNDLNFKKWEIDMKKEDRTRESIYCAVLGIWI